MATDGSFNDPNSIEHVDGATGINGVNGAGGAGGAGRAGGVSGAGAADADRPPTEAETERAVELATRLFAMARDGDSTTLVAYVDAGAPVNLANHRGDTLLMLAAYHGHADAVRLLLERGADPDRVNDRGQTPIAGAVFKREREVVRALLDAGADPRAGEPTAVDTARMFGHDDFLAWFGEPPAAQDGDARS